MYFLSGLMKRLMPSLRPARTLYWLLWQRWACEERVCPSEAKTHQVVHSLPSYLEVTKWNAEQRLSA